ncbi:uncharacterized protein K460DRAFT_416362 [Cucurbitaria berberidis CBS 394.84]|uniref:Carbonic anhydrase n=1 Tax=Cucurbitaria berberidis CBS 394.84 TaxID=1168544 RepID=A0A9P4GGY0_9PLEO|nr:uncharacterized protein K460DRAFT_416362 [Cucurbitaria berberidis CBS 394.84]KAF1845034.1 hypothetical protein K460DRAFT_416362 [Cucurbitaria berberidis CBS 394.84]
MSCNEPDNRVDPSHHFNVNGGTTQVVKTAGGRTESAANNLYQIYQSSKIGMVSIVHHTTCPWSPRDVKANIRSDVQTLKSSPYVRDEIPIIGYVLDTAKGQVQPESRSPSPPAIIQNLVMPLLWHSTGKSTPK